MENWTAHVVFIDDSYSDGAAGAYRVVARQWTTLGPHRHSTAFLVGKRGPIVDLRVEATVGIHDVGGD